MEARLFRIMTDPTNDPRRAEYAVALDTRSASEVERDILNALGDRATMDIAVLAVLPAVSMDPESWREQGRPGLYALHLILQENWDGGASGTIRYGVELF